MIINNRLVPTVTLWLTAVLASAGSFSSSAVASLPLSLPLFELDDIVILPFPERPQFFGVFPEDGTHLSVYQYTDEVASLGYSATVMLAPIPSIQYSSPIELLKDYLDKILPTIDGRLIREMDTIVDGRPARYIVASMGIVDHQAHSWTIAIYDEGRIHTWAMQVVPAISGDHGPRIFLENHLRIQISVTEQEIQPALNKDKLFRLGNLLVPFPGQPEAKEIQSPQAEIEAYLFQSSTNGFLYAGYVMSGLPKVADPAYSILRGARLEEELLEQGNMKVTDISAQYQILRSPGNPKRHTYMGAWVYADSVYIWTIYGDHDPNDQAFRDIFFQSINQIDMP